MKRVLLALWLCLVPGAPVWAASGLDLPRTQAQEARARVRELREHQQVLRAELNTLAGRIEQLKAGQKGRLVTGSELEQALQRSQELSGQLTGLAQSLAGAESEAERRHLALHTALSEELERVRAAWDATNDRRARAGLLERMRTLRAERDAVRTALPPSQVPALPGAATSDDAEDLLEQADALRDTEDKVNQRLQALRARLTEVREERELERRMSDFLGEESMFDEQDRHLRLSVDATTRNISVSATPRSGGSPTLVSRDEAYGNGAGAGGAAPPPSGGSVDYPSDPAAPPSPGQPTAPSAPNSNGTPPTTSYRATDNRPQVGTVRAQVLASDFPEDVRGLEQEAARLESLARELDSRADSLERRARELR
ncbi:TetR family transcriptional regulator [Cystobacter ferrugineus]|uniref:TetR family transcriptional regulator n=1 Tax=Cystobacter ferrugineus TaxID=83449 RepID=A0A1L9AWP4_9BACT|nr:TetR family transcriptional regulator [Cystobacter ferrugineus]OJH34435.1 TetR family transcriptional regulator [Cystobacter ferrugineus]